MKEPAGICQFMIGRTNPIWNDDKEMMELNLNREEHYLNDIMSMRGYILLKDIADRLYAYIDKDKAGIWIDEGHYVELTSELTFHKEIDMRGEWRVERCIRLYARYCHNKRFIRDRARDIFTGSSFSARTT